MQIISGGVTAAQGFQAAGMHCGVKDNFAEPQPNKKDAACTSPPTSAKT